MNKIKKGHMTYMSGFAGSPKKYEDGCRQVDWEEVKNYIEENKDNISEVSVGLAEDWSYTHAKLWENGKYATEDEYGQFYGSSTWATPAIAVTFNDFSEVTFECWKLGADSRFKNLNDGGNNI